MENHILNLPQIRVTFSYTKLSSEIILVTGGRQPSFDCFNQMATDRKIICVDHGIDFCRANNIIPNFLIGDFDSAHNDSIQWAINNNVKIERHPVDKDFTDTQLALNQIDINNFAIITGAFGGRLDHLYSTLFTCANSQIKNCLADETETVIFLNSGENAKIEFHKKPFALSLLPMSEACEGVMINGVHWSLNLATLIQASPTAISNRVESSLVNVSISSGKLAIYCNFT